MVIPPLLNERVICRTSFYSYNKLLYFQTCGILLMCADNVLYILSCVSKTGDLMHKQTETSPRMRRAKHYCVIRSGHVVFDNRNKEYIRTLTKNMVFTNSIRTHKLLTIFVLRF